MGNTASAVPARFDQGSAHRRSMIAKTHVARRQLAMTDDDYRALLFAETRQTSTDACSDRQLSAMIDALKAKGFRPIPRKAKSGHVAQHPMARKARALWISLYHLGVIDNSSEKALEAFAKRQLGCENLAWAKQSQGGKLIEALKNMATRNGWAQAGASGAQLGPWALHDGLCEAILGKLKALSAVPDDWTLPDAVEKLGIITDLREGYTVEVYQQVAATLGKLLRVAIVKGARS